MVLGEAARGMWSVRWSIGGSWQEGRGIRTPAEREIRFEGGPNWLHTMGTRKINQF